MHKVNLLDYDQLSLANYCAQIGEKPFRAQQLIKWVHQLGVTDFACMTNISMQLRAYLAERAVVALPTIAKHYVSRDGTQKWLLQLHDGKLIETVFIPEKDRGTLCISAQVGCAMGCIFCATGTLGYQRNLTTAEIIGQVWLAVRALAPDKTTKSHTITNVVLMGMGEPLLNFANVVKAIALLRDDLAYGLSKYRVTLSTVGLIPEMRQLSAVTDIALAISLHAVNDELRQQLIPISKKYPLHTLLTACKEFYRDQRRKVTFEYIMLHKINDSPEDARKLCQLIRKYDLKCKVNLIPYNTVTSANAGTSDISNIGSTHNIATIMEQREVLQPSSTERIDNFRKILMSADINTITRKTRGADIAAACGQLAAKTSL